MNKSEFIDSIAEKANISKTDATEALKAVQDSITEVLISGDQVVLPGFGTFATAHRAERDGRNPKTGETIKIKAARVAKFKVGKGLKEAVNA